MRIRKNAKLSPLLLFSTTQGGASSSVLPAETFQTHVCQLNQSPWDVIPFDSDSLQFEGEDSFTGNGSSAGDSIGAVESVASMMDAEEIKTTLPKVENMVMNDNNNHDDKGAKKVLDDNGHRGEQKRIACCQNKDEKGWPCKNEPKQGQSFCDHHLSLLRSYNSATVYNNNHPPSSKKAAAAAAAAAAVAGARRARARAAKKTPSSNPYEFYYYSGFGPLWGKRRGDRNGEGNKNNEGGIENSIMAEVLPTAAGNISPSDAAVVVQNNNVGSCSQIDNEEFGYVDDDDEEEEANGDSGKKRMRKPVKARSLKSLM